MKSKVTRKISDRAATSLAKLNGITTGSIIGITLNNDWTQVYERVPMGYRHFHAKTHHKLIIDLGLREVKLQTGRCFLPIDQWHIIIDDHVKSVTTVLSHNDQDFENITELDAGCIVIDNACPIPCTMNTKI